MFISREQYEFLKDVKLGREKGDPVLAGFAGHVRREYGISPLAFLFENSTYPLKQGLLRMYMDTAREADAIRNGRADGLVNFTHCREIKRDFAGLVRGGGLEDRYDLTGLVLSVWSFELDTREVICEDSADEFKAYLKERYADLPVRDFFANFGNPHLFYETGKQLEEYGSNGLNGLIDEDYYSFIKRRDAFDYLKQGSIRITFDSYENVVKNYEGSYFFYFQ